MDDKGVALFDIITQRKGRSEIVPTLFFISNYDLGNLLWIWVEHQEKDNFVIMVLGLKK